MYEVNDGELGAAAAHGAAVKRFVDDPEIKKVFQSITVVYFDRWMSSQTVEERERLYAQARALSDLQTSLEAAVQNGTLATLAMEQRDTSH